MNYHLKPIDFRKYTLILIFSFIGMICISWCVEFFFQRIEGDLTRIGYFPERYFGWNIKQPKVNPKLLKDYPLNQADVLVIGDSFSEPGIWQTKLIEDGLKVSTMTWSELKSSRVFFALPSNLGQLLAEAGFKGRYVIIESIERQFPACMTEFSEGQPPIVKQNRILPGHIIEREHFSFKNLNGAHWNIKAVSRMIDLISNSPAYIRTDNVRSDNTYAIKINGCEWFSNRVCNYALFVNGDFEKATFSFSANVLIVNKNLKQFNFQPIWLIVPDKATVYLGYGAFAWNPYKNVWQLPSEYPELVVPDVATYFREKAPTIKDFYLPNNTHLSVNGYLSLGEFMKSELHKLQSK